MKVTDDAHERRVRIWGANDEPLADLYLGTSPNYQVSHVRRAGEDAVFEARGLSAWDLRTDEASWVRKAFVDAPADAVLSVSVQNVHGRFTLERDTAAEDEPQWRLADGVTPRPLDDGKVDAFVQSIAGLPVDRARRRPRRSTDSTPRTRPSS